jgi:hypothetical protein
MDTSDLLFHFSEEGIVVDLCRRNCPIGGGIHNWIGTVGDIP